MKRFDRGTVLVGFMGAGKTTVGRELGELCQCGFVDLDEFLVDRTGRSIAAIMEADGEANFRELETQALIEALNAHPRAVIALGGGAWTIPANRNLISQSNVITIWLDTAFGVCWDRIQTSGALRPLAVDEAQAHALFERRRECYSEAQVTYRCADVEAPHEIARGIASMISGPPPVE